jgi:hypothetical protein
MDEAFDSFMAQDLEVAREGLAMLARRSQDSRFSNLEPTGQDQILTQIEDTAFFALVRNMTIYGYFGMHQSTEGFDDIAWTSLGVNEPVHAWEPPFGYYDGEYLEGAQDGE